MAVSYSRSDIFKTACADALIRAFNVNNVDGITERPVITKTITSRTPEPYIYIRSGGPSVEAYNTKNTEARIYPIDIEVVTKFLPQRGNHDEADQITNEVTRILTDETNQEYDLANQGFNLFIVANSQVFPIDFEERGARYFKRTITIEYTASFIGLPTTRQPVPNIPFTFNNFTFTPTGNRLETSDAGTIGLPTTVANSNGWQATSVAHAQIAGGDGTITGNDYAVEATDSTLGVTTTINWQFGDDATTTTTTTTTTNFPRIRSLRYGSIGQNSISETDLANFTLFQGTNKTFDYGRTNPIGQVAALRGNAGERFYIIFDNAITPTSFDDFVGLDNIDNFTLTTVNGYKVYLQTRALSFDNFALDLTIR